MLFQEYIFCCCCYYSYTNMLLILKKIIQDEQPGYCFFLFQENPRKIRANSGWNMNQSAWSYSHEGYPPPAVFITVGNWARGERNMVLASSHELQARSWGRIYDICFGFLIDFNWALASINWNKVLKKQMKSSLYHHNLPPLF